MSRGRKRKPRGFRRGSLEGQMKALQARATAAPGQLAPRQTEQNSSPEHSHNRKTAIHSTDRILTCVLRYHSNPTTPRTQKLKIGAPIERTH